LLRKSKPFKNLSSEYAHSVSLHFSLLYTINLDLCISKVFVSLLSFRPSVIHVSSTFVVNKRGPHWSARTVWITETLATISWRCILSLASLEEAQLPQR